MGEKDSGKREIISSSSHARKQSSELTLVEEFFQHHYFSDNTQKCYRRFLNNFFDRLGITTLAQVSEISYARLKTEVVQFFSSYESDNTKLLAASCLRSFFAYLCDLYPEMRNPVPNTRRMNIRKQRKSTTESVSFEVLQEILSRLRADKQKSYHHHMRFILVLILSSTSLRISEALQITVEMIENGVLNIVQKQKRERDLAVPVEVKAEVMAFINQWQLRNFLFQSSSKRRLDRTQAYKHVKKATGFCCHAFRKSVIEILVEQGTHPHEIAKVSGHSSLEMVHYYDATSSAPQAHLKLTKALLGEKE